jgi:hypothetical protein
VKPTRKLAIGELLCQAAHTAALTALRSSLPHIFIMHYNFGRPHKTLASPYPRTPAMAAGVEDHVWSLAEIVSLSN